MNVKRDTPQSAKKSGIICQFRSPYATNHELIKLRISPTQKIGEIKEILRNIYNANWIIWKMELVFRGKILSDDQIFGKLRFKSRIDFFYVHFRTTDP